MTAPEPAAVRPAAVAQAQTAACPLTVVRAEGAWVWGTDGTPYLDLTSGISTCNLGHNHPAVIAAARGQLERLTHCGGVFGNEPMHELAALLAEVSPPGIGCFLFATSGSEATEAALRIARRATGRPGVVAFRGGFHGRTQGALACSTSRADFRVGPLPGGIALAPFPRPLEWGGDPDRAADEALRGLDDLHRHELSPEQTACYIVEPVQGQGGCHPAGRRFLAGLRERADRHGALLVFDEVQTGFGRTGSWFAAQTYRVTPDLICLAKALGAGFPLSTVGGSAEVMAALPRGGHGSTFGGSPLSCAAGAAGLRALAEAGLIEHARTLGERAFRRLAAIARRVPALVDVRGLGLMIGLELSDPATFSPRPDLAEAVVAGALRRGVVLMRSGPGGNVIRFLPPLVIGGADLALALDALEAALLEATAAAPPTAGRLSLAA